MNAAAPMTPAQLRVFHLAADQFSELEGLPEVLPPSGYLWVAFAHDHF